MSTFLKSMNLKEGDIFRIYNNLFKVIGVKNKGRYEIRPISNSEHSDILINIGRDAHLSSEYDENVYDTENVFRVVFRSGEVSDPFNNLEDVDAYIERLYGVHHISKYSTRDKTIEVLERR